jgi:hypothetical protein
MAAAAALGIETAQTADGVAEQLVAATDPTWPYVSPIASIV